MFLDEQNNHPYAKSLISDAQGNRLFLLLPHTTHKLQPLDYGFFKSLK